MIIIISILLSVVLFLVLILLLGLFFYAIDAFLDLPYVATSRSKVNTIIKLAQIKKGQTVVDLGSGDGRLLIAAASVGAHAIGYEINPYLVVYTKIRAKLLGYSSSERMRVEKSKNISSRLRSNNKGMVTVKPQNLWKADLKIADVIFVYGRKSSMQRFEGFVYKNAKKGTRIIVNSDKTIPFPHKKPLKVENGIYLYRV